MPVDERDEFLDRCCSGDHAKRDRAESWMRRLAERELGGSTSPRSSSRSSHPQTGQVINDEYEVLEEVGRGGYGVVYRCREATLGKIVAVKMLLHGIERRKALADFLEEGRRLALLNHTNVIQVHRAGTYEGKPFIVMEYLEGKTVRQLLDETSPLPLAQALDIAAQAACGLHEVHRLGLVHRDLSARNVIVTREQTAKILDLGLSRFVDAEETTHSSTVRGTPIYLAPELLLGEPPSFASDIFSLGVLTYEMLSGDNPFRGSSMQVVVDRLLHHQPAQLDSRVPTLPRRLARLIGKCLEKSPRERLESLDGVARQFRDGIPGAANAAGSPTVPRSAVEARQNPYLNRAMIRNPADFVGRTQEVRRIYARLNASPPGSISIVGDRRIGKSSLLSYVSMPASCEAHLHDPDRTLMVYFDLQQTGRMLESILEDLVGAVRAKADGRVALPRASDTLGGLRAVIQALVGGGFRIVLLLDEFERLTRNESVPVDCYSFLRSLQQSYDIAYVTSSVRPLHELCHSKEIADSPFFNIFTKMSLGPFAPEEARALVTEPARRIGIELEPFHGFVIDGLAGHLPMFLQIACGALVDAMQSSRGAGPDLDEARRLFEDEAEPHFRFLWTSLDEGKRDVVRRLAFGEVVPAAREHSQSELLSDGYLRVREDRVQPFSDAFASFIRSECGSAGLPSLWRRVREWATGGERAV
jgi:serine/threonine protein kinase